MSEAGDHQRRALRQIRNDEIERKRARLAELRRQRQQRQQRRQLSPPKLFHGELGGGGIQSEAAHLISEVDKMLAGFGFNTVADTTVAAVTNDSVARATSECSVQTEGLGVFDDAAAQDPVGAVVKYDKLIQTETVTNDELPQQTIASATMSSDRCETNGDSHDVECRPGLPPIEFIDLDNVADLGLLAHFVSRASRYVERALSLPIDVTVDYTRESDVEGSKGNASIAVHHVFRDDAERHINWLDWSAKFPELIVVAYGAAASESAAPAPKGRVVVWSAYLPTRPEFVFQCSSEVLCAKFHPSYPTLVIGSTSSGQIVIWDQRAGCELVSATRLAYGHVTPVYGFFVTSMQSLITVSDDGRLCTWSDKILMEPTFRTDIGGDVTPICVGFSRRDPGTVHLGGENGELYRLKIEASETCRASDLVAIRAHAGPLTAISFSCSTEISKQLADLFLTASFDFTCRLWSVQRDAPLVTITKDNAVLDVQWCPSNPSHFVLAGGDGMVEIWKLGSNPYAALVRYRVCAGPCVKVSWAAHGKHIAVGDALGNLYMLNIPSSIYEADHQDILDFSKYIHNLCSEKNNEFRK